MDGQPRIWICPQCNRTFKEHVFGEGTYMSGPICNACCVHLELLEKGAPEEAAFSSGQPVAWGANPTRTF